MKKLIIGGLSVVALVVIAILVIGFFSLGPIVKAGVETIGPQLTKVEIRLGSVKLSPFSGRGELNQLFVGNPQPFKTSSAIKVGQVVLAVDPKSVASDVIVINELTVKAPELTLEGNLTGDNNLSKILANLNAAVGSSPKAKSDAPAAKGSEKKFIVKELTIEGGSVSLSLNLPLLAGKTASVPLLAIHAKDIGVAEHGVDVAQLATKIIEPMISGSIEAGGKYATELTKNLSKDATKIGSQAADEVKKSVGGLGDLFKKK